MSGRRGGGCEPGGGRRRRGRPLAAPGEAGAGWRRPSLCRVRGPRRHVLRLLPLLLLLPASAEGQVGPSSGPHAAGPLDWPPSGPGPSLSLYLSEEEVHKLIGECGPCLAMRHARRGDGLGPAAGRCVGRWLVGDGGPWSSGGVAEPGTAGAKWRSVGLRWCWGLGLSKGDEGSSVTLQWQCGGSGRGWGCSVGLGWAWWGSVGLEDWGASGGPESNGDVCVTVVSGRSEGAGKDGVGCERV